jgi:hypothetical protein
MPMIDMFAAYKQLFISRKASFSNLTRFILNQAKAYMISAARHCN